jgi:hypothetical protein
MNKKNLHKHSLPIVALMVAAFVAVAALAVYANSQDLSGSNVASSLTTRVVTIDHNSGVTADVSLNSGSANQSLPNMSQAANALALDLALEQ